MDKPKPKFWDMGALTYNGYTIQPTYKGHTLQILTNLYTGGGYKAGTGFKTLEAAKRAVDEHIALVAKNAAG